MPQTAGFTGFSGYIGPAGLGAGSPASAYGGIVIPMLATAALNVGEAVYVSAAGHVDKGATANLAAGMGVVVGGQASRWRCYPEVPFGSVAASAAEQWVLVCVYGKARALSDAAVAAGVAVGFGGTAGRLDDLVTDATTVVGTRLGKSLSAAGGAAAEFDVFVSVM